jgi:hypothetical protein
MVPELFKPCQEHPGCPGQTPEQFLWLQEAPGSLPCLVQKRRALPGRALGQRTTLEKDLQHNVLSG